MLRAFELRLLTPGVGSGFTVRKAQHRSCHNSPIELQSRSKALAGDFDGAITSIQAAQLPLSSEILEKIRIFERQGQLGLAKDIGTVKPADGALLVDQTLVAAARAYVQCFTDGAWADALQEVHSLFESFLAIGCQLNLSVFIVSGIGACSFTKVLKLFLRLSCTVIVY